MTAPINANTLLFKLDSVARPLSPKRHTTASSAKAVILVTRSLVAVSSLNIEQD